MSLSVWSYRQESENATELAVGELANGAGPSTNMGLGVQGTKIGRTIKSFDDACVYLLFSACPLDRRLIAM